MDTVLTIIFFLHLGCQYWADVALLLHTSLECIFRCSIDVLLRRYTSGAVH